jgi:hypothetical protein
MINRNSRQFAIREPYYNTAPERCTKCTGKMELDYDYKSGYFRTCLNCGKTEYVPGNAANKRLV